MNSRRQRIFNNAREDGLVSVLVGKLVHRRVDQWHGSNVFQRKLESRIAAFSASSRNSFQLSRCREREREGEQTNPLPDRPIFKLSRHQSREREWYWIFERKIFQIVRKIVQRMIVVNTRGDWRGGCRLDFGEFFYENFLSNNTDPKRNTRGIFSPNYEAKEKKRVQRVRGIVPARPSLWNRSKLIFPRQSRSMRGEVKRFKKVSKLEAYRSDGSPKTSFSSLSLSLSLSRSLSLLLSLAFV